MIFRGPFRDKKETLISDGPRVLRSFFRRNDGRSPTDGQTNTHSRNKILPNWIARDSEEFASHSVPHRLTYATLALLFSHCIFPERQKAQIRKLQREHRAPLSVGKQQYRRFAFAWKRKSGKNGLQRRGPTASGGKGAVAITFCAPRNTNI